MSPPSSLALPPLPVPWPLTLRLSLQDATRVHRLALALPLQKGAVPMSPRDAMRIALEIAAQVAEAGELDRFRATRAALAGPKVSVSPATLAWMEQAAEDTRGRAVKAARTGGAGTARRRR